MIAASVLPEPVSDSAISSPGRAALVRAACNGRSSAARLNIVQKLGKLWVMRWRTRFTSSPTATSAFLACRRDHSIRSPICSKGTKASRCEPSQSASITNPAKRCSSSIDATIGGAESWNARGNAFRALSPSSCRPTKGSSSPSGSQCLCMARMALPSAVLQSNAGLPWCDMDARRRRAAPWEPSNHAAMSAKPSASAALVDRDSSRNNGTVSRTCPAIFLADGSRFAWKLVLHLPRSCRSAITAKRSSETAHSSPGGKRSARQRWMAGRSHRARNTLATSMQWSANDKY